MNGKTVKRVEIDSALPEIKLPPQILPGLYRGDYGLLTAMGGTGKSFFALTWAVFRLLGLEFYADRGLPPLNKVTFMAFEENSLILQKRITDILRFFSQRLRNQVFQYPEFWDPLISEEEVQRVIDRLIILSFKGVPVRLLQSDGTMNIQDVAFLKKISLTGRTC